MHSPRTYGMATMLTLALWVWGLLARPTGSSLVQLLVMSAKRAKIAKCGLAFTDEGAQASGGGSCRAVGLVGEQLMPAFDARPATAREGKHRGTLLSGVPAHLGSVPLTAFLVGKGQVAAQLLFRGAGEPNSARRRLSRSPRFEVDAC